MGTIGFPKGKTRMIPEFLPVFMVETALITIYINRRPRLKIKNPENCLLIKDSCPYLIGNLVGYRKVDAIYLCGKANSLFKCRIDAAIMTRQIKRRKFPKCQWEKERAA